MSNNTVIVKLLDKEYQVACPPGQQQALTQSAQYLDDKMRDIRSSGKVIGLERIAVMAALNISNEFLQNDGEIANPAAEASRGSDRQLKGLNDKLEEALLRFRQLEIG